jgi:PAS domain S-box-containing protein
MRRWAPVSCVGVCFIAACASGAEAETSAPNILVLNSYHPGYAWSDDEMAGIIEALRKKDDRLEPFVECLDGKHFPRMELFPSQAEHLRQKYERVKLSLVIVADNPALEFLLRYRAGLFPGVPVVFCGINGFMPEMLAGQAHITGVAENLDIEGTLEIALRLHPRTQHVYFIHDYTTTGLATRRAAEALLPRFANRVRVEFSESLDLAEIQAKVRTLTEDSVVLVSSFANDRAGQVFDHPRAAAVLAPHCRVPMYALHEARLGHGVVGGFLTGGRYHGQRAAEVALRVLAGADPAGIPVVTESTSRPMFDHLQLGRFGVPLSALPEGSLVINRPESFYEKYRALVLGTLAVVAGLILLTFVLGLNIVKRRRAEKELRDSEGRYRRIAEEVHDLYNHAPCGYHSLDADGVYVRVNDTELAWLGYSREEVIGRKFPDILTAESQRAFRENFASLKERGRLNDVEYEVVRKDGTSLPVLLSATVSQDAFGRFLMSRATMYDLSVRKRAEEALRESEQRYRGLVEVSPDAIFINRGGQVVFINRAGLKLFGADRPEQMLGKSPFDFTHPDYHALVRERIRQQLELGQPVPPVEQKVYRLDGTLVDVEVAAVPIVDQGQKAIQAVLRDITKRKRAEAALKQSFSLLRATFESTADGILVVDPSGKITDFNERFAQLWRLPEAVLASRDDRQALEFVLNQLKDPEGFLAKVRQLYAQPEAESFDVLEFKDGRTFERYSRPQWVEGRPVGRVWSFRDVTERERAEEALRGAQEQLRQVQKMEAIGQLAGGIAHDFNNQLTGILGFAEMLRNRLDDEGLRRYADLIIGSARRSADLTGQLLAFARRGKYQSVPVNVHNAIAEVVELLGRSVDKRIAIKQVLSANPPAVLGDPTQLQSAFLNLAINACDAMPNGGELLFATDVVVLNDEFCLNTPYEISAGRYLQVCVTDSGTGMSEETKKHLFEPFFTTKKAGKGTGLGLASVYGVVRNHKGALSVYSELGHGSTFKVCLPLLETAGEEQRAAAGERAQPRGTARILVVDDEEVVLKVASEVLRDLGYHVTTCKDGREAVAYYREAWRDVDLVLLDMVMPNLSGRDTFLAMRQINPAVKAILSSGYSMNGQAQGILDEGVLDFIQKPYRLAELSRKVVAALQR